jgi:hypothetical protein
MARRQSPRLAKSLRCYTIAETASLYSVHRQTVRQWLRNGLRPIDFGRPTLIHGRELNRFQKVRAESRKQRCGPCEVFCLGCRAPRRPALDMADFVPAMANVGMLSAVCPVCGRLMTQKVNTARLALFQAVIDVRIRPAHEPIKQSRECGLSCHLRNEVVTHGT